MIIHCRGIKTLSNPKRHHVVPKAYLEGFTEPDTGFLNIYSKRGNMWRRQKPKQVMVRNKYYHQDGVPDGVDNNILEKVIGEGLEPDGLAALSKLIEKPDDMSGEDISKVIDYVVFQRVRVPRQIEMAGSLTHTRLKNAMSKSDIGRCALGCVELSINDSFKFHLFEAAHGPLARYFSRMVWEVIKADDEASFITSDSPVAFYNEDFAPPKEPGPAFYGTTVLFPINKRYLLSMHHFEYETGEKNASDKLPKDTELEEGTLRIRSGRICSKQQVREQNYILYQLSQDVIVGESKGTLENVVQGKILGE